MRFFLFTGWFCAFLANLTCVIHIGHPMHVIQAIVCVIAMIISIFVPISIPSNKEIINNVEG